MNDKYILDENRNPVRVDLLTWAKWFEEKLDERIVKKDVVDGLRVSTVFIGLDHNFYGDSEDHKPHIFETMIFGSDGSSVYCERYSTWNEAEKSHEEVLNMLKGKT